MVDVAQASESSAGEEEVKGRSSSNQAQSESKGAQATSVSWNDDWGITTSKWQRAIAQGCMFIEVARCRAEVLHVCMQGYRILALCSDNTARVGLSSRSFCFDRPRGCGYDHRQLAECRPSTRNVVVRRVQV
ncbi:hypothetical protein GUITHDRAFT_110997 [Guillardia theta CCMP2712]|uniref:Uncharacterized protein n=1 Tax=Guillardia theta (strain CCMP2712) TaxID=905079 RepID=L1J368_GUITC|nr:hypothetical protein GUITHDRAFT_110997 [Guillardia theta CCMP2712]EKX42951.1 hypothetical protein GUITHDRAFT_110997 [Guillardia theta CCMP2712]|eukprot:XP_005829931.1 hypothetical protein GUITHDRAFT_110997 [Guillardia theta CCMP2712]